MGVEIFRSREPHDLVGVCNCRTFGAAALIILVLSRAAHAADLQMPPPQSPAPVLASDQGLVFAVTAYGWASGLSGRARTQPPLPAVNVHVTFDKVLRNLDGAFMSAAELRSGRFILFTDFIFAKIAPSKEFAVPRTLGLGVSLDSTSAIGLVAAGYRLVDDPRFIVDGFAGVRGFSLDNTLKLDLGTGRSPTVRARPGPILQSGRGCASISATAGTRRRSASEVERAASQTSSAMPSPASATPSTSATRHSPDSACSRSTTPEAIFSTTSSNMAQSWD